MPIDVTCDCGKRLRVKDELAGKRARCPGCQTILTVPDSELEEVLPADEDDRPRRGGVRLSDEVIRRRRDEDDLPRRPRLEPEDDPDEDDRPRRRRRRRDSGGSVEQMGTIGAGLLMIVGAIVWFVLGLMANIIFFYPPVLLIIGIVTVVKGIMGNSD